jgi:thymidylate synthase (FAD)
MCELKLHVRVPMDAWRQWIRHRTASVNEYSTRYSEAIDSRQTTAPDQWRSQAKNNKQGSGNFLDPVVGKEMTEAERSSHSFSDTIYQERLAKGVAREQARKDLPLSTYTEAYWKCNLHNLLHFLRLRMDSHAQKEIRDYACVIGEEIVKGWVPAAWGAFEDYRMNSLQLTAIDQRMMQAISQENGRILAEELGWVDEHGTPKRARERTEFEAKAVAMGIEIPWNGVAVG